MLPVLVTSPYTVTQNLPFSLTVAGIHFAYLWLSWPGWLVKYQDDGLYSKLSTVVHLGIVTGLDVQQLRWCVQRSYYILIKPNLHIVNNVNITRK